jgi:hypothetical protein
VPLRITGWQGIYIYIPRHLNFSQSKHIDEMPILLSHIKVGHCTLLAPMASSSVDIMRLTSSRIRGSAGRSGKTYTRQMVKGVME